MNNGFVSCTLNQLRSANSTVTRTNWLCDLLLVLKILKVFSDLVKIFDGDVMLA